MPTLIHCSYPSELSFATHIGHEGNEDPLQKMSARAALAYPPDAAHAVPGDIEQQNGLLEAEDAEDDGYAYVKFDDNGFPL